MLGRSHMFSHLPVFFALTLFSLGLTQDFEAYLEILLDNNKNDSLIFVDNNNPVVDFQYYNDDYVEPKDNDTANNIWHSVIIVGRLIDNGVILDNVTEIVSPETPQQCSLVSESNRSSNQSLFGLCLSKTNATCQVCIPGFTIITSRQNCEPCREGHHKTNYGIDPCTPCQVGWSTLGLKGQAICWPCLEGSSTMGLSGQSTCTPCTLYSQAKEVGSKGCMCVPGTALDYSRTLCIPCEPGYRDIYFNETDREIPGPAAPTSSKNYCVPCIPGKISEIRGASDCSPCLPGTFASSYGQSQCIACPVNTFAHHPNAAMCDPCLNGSFTLSNQSVSCMCPAGTVKQNETECASCKKGEYQPYNESSLIYPDCLKCQPGTYSPNIGNSACLDCPVGTYQPDMGSSQCLNCGQYFYTKTSKSTSFSQDCKCIAGFIKYASSACIPCPPSYYQNLPDSSDCLACPVYTTSLNNGSTSCDSCVPGSILSNSGTQKCVLCRPGFYQPPTSVNQVKCLQCPSGSFSGLEGATECILCVANSYASLDGSSECLPCPVYSETGGSIGSSRCSCSLGYVASVTDTCVPCLPGFFQLDHGGMCKACAAGTYTPNPASHGPLACLLCDIGTFASSSGQSSCSTCHPNSENTQRGSATCFCIMGMGLLLQDSNNNSECVPCAPGHYQPSLALYCIACPAGYFNNQSKSSNCSQCAQGTYSAFPKSLVCLECIGGSVTNFNQTSCVCPGGSLVFNQSYTTTDSFLPPTILWKCSPCTPHCKYGETFMSQECTSNQDSVCQACKTECPIGKYITANCTAAKDITCTSCSVGCKVGSFMSVPCTKYNNMICSQCTQACPTNRFAIASVCTFGKDLTCVLCPPGSYSAKTDGTIGGCIQCPPGYITPLLLNSTTDSCSACPHGMYSNPTQTQCIASCLPSTYPTSKNSCGICPPLTGGDGSGCVEILDNTNRESRHDICKPEYKY